MKFLTAITAASLAGTASASGNAVFVTYNANSKVQDHGRIDLAAKALGSMMGAPTNTNLAGANQYTVAKYVYSTSVGKSSQYVSFVIPAASTATTEAKGTYTCKITGDTDDIGTLKNAVTTTSTKVDIYLDSSVQAAAACGGVPFATSTETWAAGTTAGSGSFGGSSVFKHTTCPKGGAAVLGAADTITCVSAANTGQTLVLQTGTASDGSVAGAISYGGRTLKGFSTQVQAKMITTFEPEALAVKNYHKVVSYGDQHVSAALEAISGTTDAFGVCDNAAAKDETECKALSGAWTPGTAICKHATTHDTITGLTGNFAAKKTDCTSAGNGGLVTDFGLYTGAGEDLLKQTIKKMAVFTNVWLYTVHEFEDAIDDCAAQSPTDNDAGVKAWDEGVAFWTGSIAGADATGGTKGNLLYMLANKRCSNFKTCVGGTTSGQSQVNIDLFSLFNQGKNVLNQKKCGDGQLILDQIIPKMTVPLIQGTLRYAYKVGTASSDDAEAFGEGYAFMMSVIHRVGKCKKADADVIYKALDIPATNPGAAFVLGNSATFAQVKTAFENNYACMGVTCADVGGLYDDSAGAYYTGAAPCTDPASASSAAADDKEKLPTWAIGAIAVCGFFAVAFFGMMCAFKQQKDKSIKLYEDLKAGK